MYSSVKGRRTNGKLNRRRGQKQIKGIILLVIDTRKSGRLRKW